ncbi:MAG TPA: hypothetical protein VI980_11575 [Acidimicrobiia bacterium]|nr:hypothetical protein [Acidimicrobiia bacterium]
MPALPLARTISLALAVAIAAFAMSAAVLFQAPRPGADLAPLGGSENLVQILQGNQSVLWFSLSGRVTGYVVQGWPSTSGGDELGGALMMERPANGEAGVIGFGEKPMTLRFEVAG